MGAERKSQYLEQKDKLATAYHEVCIVAAQTPLDDRIHLTFVRLGRTCPRRPVHGWSNAIA
jgi:ATP-dependent Zn protease